MRTKYWEDCISEAFEDAKIQATEDQIKTVAHWVEGAFENEGLATGRHAIPSPANVEIERLEAELKKERNKSVCPQCSGAGRLVSHGPIHSSDSVCWKCNGEGKASL